MAGDRRIRAALTAVVFTVIGCGGEDSGRTRPRALASVDASVDPCTVDDGFEFLSIEDFEGSGPLRGQASNWYTNNDDPDGAFGSTMIPAAGITSPDATELQSPRCAESAWALHVVATGLKIWGASFGLNFANNRLDVARDYDGLSFWARHGPDSVDDAGVTHRSGRSVFASVAEKYSDENGASLLAAGGQLPDGGSPLPHCRFEHVDTRQTCDRFGAGVGLDTEWRFYTIRFDEMRQSGFGRPAPSLVPDRVLIGINFGLGAGDWDFWLDDVALFRAARADQ